MKIMEKKRELYNTSAAGWPSAAHAVAATAGDYRDLDIGSLWSPRLCNPKHA